MIGTHIDVNTMQDSLPTTVNLQIGLASGDIDFP